MSDGDLIIIPTDTVYGLAAKLYDDKALEKIYEIKDRDQSKKIPILISNINQLKEICIISDLSLKLMKKYWPGALTIILRTTKTFKEKTNEDTIAVRMPNHPIALKLIDTYGILRVTSLNKSGEQPLTNIEEIKKIFGLFIKEIYPQGDISKSDISSTIVDLTNDHINVLRQGNINISD
ncbi:L-threonylcarbamoyladenylate synthase [Mariniplasma anaerobium]|nr:L-threonylcarbamoyladenylate synthase [Mariniplasma anaerobium]